MLTVLNQSMFFISVLFLRYAYGHFNENIIYKKVKNFGSFSTPTSLTRWWDWHECARACRDQGDCHGFYHERDGRCSLCDDLCYNRAQSDKTHQQKRDLWQHVKREGALEVQYVPTTTVSTSSASTTSTTLLPTLGLKKNCEEVGYTFLKNTLMCVKFHLPDNDKKKWSEASKSCTREGAMLAKLDTEDKNKQIRQYIDSDPKLKGSTFYIGAHRNDNDEKWTWEDATEVVNFYYDSETRAAGRCINLHERFGHNWNNGDCNYPQGYICEMEDVVKN